MQRRKDVDIVTIAGTRPEIIKLADLVPILNSRYHHVFVYTGQHYSNNMKDIFFRELNLSPDYDLRCNTSEINILKNHIHEALKILRPNYVVVYGYVDVLAAHAGRRREPFGQP